MKNILSPVFIILIGEEPIKFFLFKDLKVTFISLSQWVLLNQLMTFSHLDQHYPFISMINGLIFVSPQQALKIIAQKIQVGLM